MFLLFDEMVGECWNDVDVEVVIDDVQSSEFCVKKLADWINPYTYTFSAPGSTRVDDKLTDPQNVFVRCSFAPNYFAFGLAYR